MKNQEKIDSFRIRNTDIGYMDKPILAASGMNVDGVINVSEGNGWREALFEMDTETIKKTIKALGELVKEK